MLNRGYAYTTIITTQHQGQTLLAHLATLYPHATPQAWQQNLTNGEVTLNGVPATGAESLTAGQTLIWNRPPGREPDAPLHFDVLFEDPTCWPSTNPAACPRSPAAASWSTPSCASSKSSTPPPTRSTAWAAPPPASSSSPKHPRPPQNSPPVGTPPASRRSTDEEKSSVRQSRRRAAPSSSAGTCAG
jgi:hypothetical protein